MVGDRGLFVTVDGPSGVGKTTVSRLLGLKLEAQGLDVLVTATPSGSKLGSLARGCTYKLRGMALTCLVAADRYHHDWEVVRPALAGGAVVVCDRYVPSSLVLDVLDGIEPKVVQTLYGAITRARRGDCADRRPGRLRHTCGHAGEVQQVSLDE